MKVLLRIARLLDRVTTGCGYCGAFLILAGMFGISLDVFSRYFFNRPFGVAFDISRWTLLYATLLMGAWVLQEDGHIKIDIILVRLKERTRALVETITSLLIILGCLAIFYQGIVSVAEQLRSGMETSDTTVIKKFWLTISIPLGSSLLIWQALKRFRASILTLVAFWSSHP